MPPPRGTGRRAVPHPPAPQKAGPNLIPWIVGGVVLLAVGGFFLLRSGDAPAHPEPAPPPRSTARKDPPPPVPPPPAPVDTGPDDPNQRLKWIVRKQAAAPNEFKKWHEELTALLAKAKGSPLEANVRDEIERLEAAAHKEFRSVFRPMRERINALLEARKGREAAQALREWKLPTEFTFSDTIRADLDAEVGRLTKIAAIDEIADTVTAAFQAGQDAGDPQEKLAEFLKSPDISVRMPAEYALRKLRFLVVARAFKIAMDGRRSEAETRIATLKKTLASETEGKKSRIEQWEKRLQEATKSAPLSAQTLGLTGTMQFRILKFDGDNLTYGNASVEMKTSLLALKPVSIGQILELAVDPRDADALLDAGRLAVRVGALDSADRMIRAAVRLKPAFEATAPSMDKIRRGVGILRGKAEVAGDRVSLTYAFDKPDEVEDFKPWTKVFTDVSGGSLHLSRGDALFLAEIGNAEFSGNLRMRVKTAAGDGKGGHAFGFRWEVSPGEADLLLVLVLPQGVRILSIEGRETKVRKDIPVEKPWSDFELTLKGKQCELKGAGASIWSDTLTVNNDVRAIIGGIAINDAAQAGVAYASLDLEGRGAPDWIRAMRSERRALVEGELSKELKVLASAGGPRTQARDFGTDIARPLPAEEAFRDAFSDEAKKALAAWRRQLEEYGKATRKDDLTAKSAQVTAALDAVVRESHLLPFGYYYRAEWKFETGDPVGALADLDEALQRHENFVEAHIAKAELYWELWKFEDAAKSIDAALERVPDLARPRLTRALLHYYLDRYEAATQELGLAMRLAPEDLGLRLEALRLERILGGPRWTQEIRIDTEHYLVRVELAAGNAKEAAAAKDRAERAAKTLEIARTWFVELIPGEERQLRKPLVYLFQSPESYYMHLDLAYGGRRENSLGIYFPYYQQLNFFLGGGTEEEVFGTLIHEAFHEYIRSVAGHTPIWFNEGHAEYVSSAVIENGKVTSAGGMLQDRLATLRRALRGGFKGIPFRQIMTETSSQFMENDPAMRYAQSWSMIHFFKHSGNADYRAALDAYIQGLLKRTPPRKLMEEAFKGIDFKQMQAEWLEYIKKW